MWNIRHVGTFTGFTYIIHSESNQLIESWFKILLPNRMFLLIFMYSISRPLYIHSNCCQELLLCHPSIDLSLKLILTILIWQKCNVYATQIVNNSNHISWTWTNFFLSSWKYSLTLTLSLFLSFFLEIVIHFCLFVCTQWMGIQLSNA